MQVLLYILLSEKKPKLCQSTMNDFVYFVLQLGMSLLLYKVSFLEYYKRSLQLDRLERM